MKFAIADPPYPPSRAVGGSKPRASRWYGSNQRSASDITADQHPEADDWDDPVVHRDLLNRLMSDYDGWAIATTPDGLHVYEPLPPAVRLMAWVRLNAQPGAHRLRSCWEAVIVYPAAGRRSNRGVGMTPDVLVHPAPTGSGFRGTKPPEWTQWVLAALSVGDGDEVDDLFPGSGSVRRELEQA